jgi:hypothetical protein
MDVNGKAALVKGKVEGMEERVRVGEEDVWGGVAG